MIDRQHEVSISKQAKALKISLGSVYYLPRPVSAANLAVMRWMDVIGRQHVATLMKRMGIEAIYRKPNTSKPAPGHKILPVSPAQRAGHQAQPGLGDGPHLHPHGAGLCLSRGRRRLVQLRACLSVSIDENFYNPVCERRSTALLGLSKAPRFC
jgi:hypothetical protein